MAYTMLKRQIKDRKHDLDKYSLIDRKGEKLVEDNAKMLEDTVVKFIRESCQGLRFDTNRATKYDDVNLDCDGNSISKNQIPYNMEKDIDRLCLQNVIDRFLDTGKKEDAFDIYFCYIEMFIGNYEKSRRMIELLSEFEANGSGLLMKHRDHYSHSVYVFCLGLAIFESNENYRQKYMKFYNITDENEAACHFLQYWGLASLFHDIGYPFELPFEQVASYFEVDGIARSKRPYISYNGFDSFTKLSKSTQIIIGNAYGLPREKMLHSTDEVFAYDLHQKLGSDYYFASEEDLLTAIKRKPSHPNEFGFFMDHAVFSATVLFKKLFEEDDTMVSFGKDWKVTTVVDSLSAIILHNSLYKFCIAFYKTPANIKFRAELHPLAYMLMLCDELQCWDRTAYGRNSKLELHPMDCLFDFSSKNVIKAKYLFDDSEIQKINVYEKNASKGKKLKAYSSYAKKTIISRGEETVEVCEFQADIEQILDLSEIRLEVSSAVISECEQQRRSTLSNSNFISLYTFAGILNGIWLVKQEWDANKKQMLEDYLGDPDKLDKIQKSFDSLSLEYKLSNIRQAKAFGKYLQKINCFYTNQPVDFDMVEFFTNEELNLIGPLEHQSWLQEHLEMGWGYMDKADIKKQACENLHIDSPEAASKEQEKAINKEMSRIRENERLHWAMLSDLSENDFVIKEEDAKAHYTKLNTIEKDKDTDPMTCMLTLLKLYDGIRIYTLDNERKNRIKDEENH